MISHLHLYWVLQNRVKNSKLKLMTVWEYGILIKNTQMMKRSILIGLNSHKFTHSLPTRRGVKTISKLLIVIIRKTVKGMYELF